LHDLSVLGLPGAFQRSDSLAIPSARVRTFLQEERDDSGVASGCCADKSRANAIYIASVR
jgi:hypothetical protein